MAIGKGIGEVPAFEGKKRLLSAADGMSAQHLADRAVNDAVRHAPVFSCHLPVLPSSDGLLYPGPLQRPENDLGNHHQRSEEHTSELQSLMRISYAVFCLKKKKTSTHTNNRQTRDNQTYSY